ncbi:MAG: hypothetical protein ACI4KF_05890 [Huintestinicola sp.]
MAYDYGDKKGAPLFFSDFFKCALFIVFVMAGCFIYGFLIKMYPSELTELFPAAFACIVTFLFLCLAEGGKRSFFAKGFFVENTIPPLVTGFLTAVIPIIMIVALRAGFADTSANGLEHIYLSAAHSAAIPLFLTISIYGYIFHIISQDAGYYGYAWAVVICTVLFTAAAVFLKLFVSVSVSEMDTLYAVLYIVNIALTGAFMGMCILRMGDIRSAAMHITVQSIVLTMITDACRNCAYSPLVNIRYGHNIVSGNGFGLYCSPVMTMISALSLIILLRRK